ncbi:MAG TPA: [protein-PII] uridylyltransferase [Porticoccus sp.]|nr:[protein-PII] uridylyltransferase [Porticoccus sp.]
MTSPVPATQKPLLFFDERRFLEDLNTKNPIEVFKNAIEAANAHLNARFHEGEQTSTLIFERASFMDLILRHAWDRFEWSKNISLLAVGGYGRGELHPQSDIDLMLLIRRGSPTRYQKSIEGFLTFLWDIQLKIGQSVRSLSQCVDEAKIDITVATNLMETRTISGDEKLRLSMLKKTGPRKIWSSKDFFRAKWDEQIERHQKHGNTEYNLEPNIKEAPGGLRDIQMINWVAKRHFKVESLEELVGKEFLTLDEYLQLKRGEAFLWRVRYELHLIAERPEERLQFDYQRKIATLLGYHDSDERLGVEQFMQHYYQVVLSMRELNDVMLQYLDEVILHKDKAGRIEQLNERFQVRNQHIETVGEYVFAKYPSALLEIFCLLGENENIIGIRAATIRQIRQHRKLIDDNFRNEPQNKRLFLRLFRCPYKLSTQLQRMTRYGILGRYLPEFGRIIGQTQHDLFHRYPVDAHTLQLIKNMRNLDRPEAAEEFPVSSHIYKNLFKPELAFIAGLYHDMGKGRGGDHSVLGAVDAANFCERHGLPAEEVNLISWLVENHLLMSSTSQRSDISDPDVIHKFAKVIGNQRKLDYLFVLTVADITATNPTLWNSWKGSLMRQLYAETRKALQRGLENPVDRNGWVKNSKLDAIKKLAESGIDETQARAIWGNLDDEFFLREHADDIATYTAAIATRGDDPEPVILIKDAGVEIPVATQIFIHTNGLDNVFPITAATLDQLQLTIQDASLHSDTQGNTFDTFYVLDENNKPFGHNTGMLDRIQSTLSDTLRNPSQSTFKVQRRTPRDLKHFTLRTIACLSNDIEKSATILEVITPDRPGLLANLGRIFMRFELRLLSAKISTLGERVEDVFHLVDMDYQPLSDAILCAQLSDAICSELDTRNKEDIEGAPLQKMKLWQ